MKHDNRCYCLFSGSYWMTEQYGVDFVVSDQVLGQYCSDITIAGPRVLRAVRDCVLGPGHNSLVLGPDNETWFIVHYAWDASMQRRQMCIDPIRWTSDGPRCLGPTWTPSPMPTME